MARILVIDDEPGIQFAFEAMINDLGHEALSALTAGEGLEKVSVDQPDIIFLDYRLPDRSGLDILPELRSSAPDAAIICMTAYGAMDVAVGAMRDGAYDYLTKPLDLEEVANLISRILTSRPVLKSSMLELGTENTVQNLLVGESPAMQEIYKLIGLLTGNTVTVLVTGESGVGKELVARAIHESGPRAAQPWVPVNCGAIPDRLIESELFGYEPGAFTGAVSRKPGKFELANGGTLFLDEVSELSLSAQVKLLRILQEQCFERLGGTKIIKTDVRIVAATNKDLKEMVDKGAFRHDLYYRLKMMTIHVPPLRERKEDIPVLTKHFLSRIATDAGKSIKGITEDAMNRLSEYSWPGNVRQLENELRRAVVICRDAYLDSQHLDLKHDECELSADKKEQYISMLNKTVCSLLREAFERADTKQPLFARIVSLVEKALVDEALNLFDNNQVHAANFLKISRSTLRKKLSQR